MYEERVLKAVLRFGLDKQSLQQVQAGTKTIGEALKQLESQAESTRRKMMQFREIGNTLGSISMTMRDVGRGVGGDLGKALEKVGNIGDAVSRGIRLYADVKMIWASSQQVLAARMMDSAATKNIAAAVQMQSASAAGAVAGVGRGLMGTIGMALPWIGLAIGAATMIAQAAGDGITKSINEAFKQARDAGRISNADYQRQVNPEGYQKGLDAYRKLREDEAEAEREYGEQRVEIVEDYARQVADTEEAYAKQRARLIEDFAEQQKQAQEEYQKNQARQFRDFYEQQSQAESDYYAERARMAENYNRDIQRMEEDHQRAMSRSKEDHDARMQELLESGDVKGLEKEMRTYERNRRRAEEDYGVQAGRKSEDYARELAEREALFAQERAQNLRAFQQRMADEAADFASRQAQAKQQHDERLKQLDEQHEEELARLDEANKEKMADLEANYTDERRRRKEAYRKQLEDLGIFLQTGASFWTRFFQGVLDQLGYISELNGAPPGRASGGYVENGVYRLGEMGTEFVLSARTTRAAEVAAGGRLSQERVLAALSGRGGAVTWNDHRRFDSRLSNADRRAIQQDTLNVMKQLYGGL